MEKNKNKHLPWYKIWIDALFRPSIATFELFLKDEKATPKRAYIWMILSGIIGGIVSAFYQPYQKQYSPIIMAACSIPLFAILAVLMIIIISWLIQLLAHALGGRGTYSKLVYTQASFDAPMTIISAILIFIPYGIWINAAFGIYWLILSAIAVKAVNQFEWKKVIISILPIILLTILVIFLTPMLSKYL